MRKVSAESELKTSWCQSPSEAGGHMVKSRGPSQQRTEQISESAARKQWQSELAKTELRANF